MTYVKLRPEERKIGVNKPDHPDAVRFHTRWFLPLPLIPDDERVDPETRPDVEGIDHKRKCKCHVCRRDGFRGVRLVRGRRNKSKKFLLE